MCVRMCVQMCVSLKGDEIGVKERERENKRQREIVRISELVFKKEGMQATEIDKSQGCAFR